VVFAATSKETPPWSPPPGRPRPDSPRRAIIDRFAEPLVRAVGIDVSTRIAAGELDAIETESGVDSAAFGQPLGLHHQQRHDVQLRGVGVEFAVTLIDVDDDAFGVQPSRVLAEVDGVGGFGP